MTTHDQPQPARDPRPDRLAQHRRQAAARQRELEDRVLAAADTLGDAAPAQLAETAASIRDHRTDQARRTEQAHRDALAALDRLATGRPRRRVDERHEQTHTAPDLVATDEPEATCE